MPGFGVRRREQQIAFFFGMTCLTLCACTDGKSTPLGYPDAGEAGSGGTHASTAGHSGMSAIDASVDDDDDEPMLTSKCQSVDAMWPVSAASEEAKMVDELNALRSNQTRLCAANPWGSPGPLTADPALQCAARMRARSEGSAKTGSTPDWFTNPYFDPRSQEQSYARERARDAGSVRIDAEIVFFNAATAAGIIDALKAHSDKAGDFCSVATQGPYWFVGVARYGSVWVMSFSSGAPTRPPTSGMGPSGPGNPGTAGR